MSDNRYPEILAPAGAEPQLMAAVRCGADAVYLGARGFNARQGAANFDEQTLPKAVAYCHERAVKVYVTLNTLLNDREIPQLLEQLELIARSGADALIIQDLAVLRLATECCPEIARHASTQLAIHNTDGALAARDLGFSRAVLARELSLREMERVISSVNGMEFEVFVHGAHCMSLSGACYMSSVIGERSGNRGFCAQPCRTNFVCRGREYALSLKDMSYLQHLRELTGAGVSSFKIEGRMKRPEYVAAAVTACRLSLDGKPYDIVTLESAFSRSGFTDGYLTGRRDGSMFGRRTEADEQRSRQVADKLASLYRSERRSVELSGVFRASPGRELSLQVSDGENIVLVSGAPPEAAVNSPTGRELVVRQLEKTGGTPYFFGRIDLQLDGDAAIPASAINSLRRQALERMSELRGRPQPKAFSQPLASAEPSGRGAGVCTGLFGRFERPEQLPEDCRELQRIILPVHLITQKELEAFGERLVGELPAALFPDNEQQLQPLLEKLRSAGLAWVYTENIYGITAARRLDLRVIGGQNMNIMNSLALKEVADPGVEGQVATPELTLRGALSLAGPVDKGIIAYGRLPLMTIRACPAAASPGGCRNCDGAPGLTDRRNISFPVLCRQRRYVSVLNSLPLYMGDKDLSGFDFRLLYFTTESREECDAVIRGFLSGAQPRPGEFTRGLYYRTIK